MLDGDFLQPIEFMVNSTCLKRLFGRSSEKWLTGWSLDYLANLFLTKKEIRVSVLKAEFTTWLAKPLRRRSKWQTNIIESESEFLSAEKIIIPFHFNLNHWTVFYFDSTRRMVEYFDSYHAEPSTVDIASLSDFLKVIIEIK